ncbi:hypothetical protein VKT23_009609 [Stygiomarasmius scandens]|uniref:AB hydrolase-1 domain-containing protein n=1 Tax=Marasmiellus scandens TaxID=2682957 RepID=A0ABR1JEV9_9AGAR
MRNLLSITLCASLAAAEHVYSGFNPRAYEKRSATCKAVKRDEGNAIVDITLSYVDINPTAKQTLLMVHGWPSLWSSWAYQIEEFKDEYHLIVPDLRGLATPGIPEMSRDAGVEKAVCVGHDWGSAVCYEAARSRPDVFEGVIGGVVPYIPSAGNYTPVAHLVPFLPKLTYQLFFDKKTPEAVKELNEDIRRSLRSTLRMKASPPPEDFLKDKDSFLDAWKDYEEIPPIPFLDKEEEDYFVENYEKSGFDNTLQFYTDENRYASWKFVNDQGNFTIPQPVLAILPLQDPVADWAIASKLLKSEDFLPNLTTEMLPGSHWVQLDHGDLFNSAMRKWLEQYFPALPATEEQKHDEL